MFEHRVVEEAPGAINLGCVEFIDLYARFREDIGKEGMDRVRIAKFAARVDAMWERIPQDQRKVIVDNMVFKKMIPAEVKKLLEMFNGKIIKLG
jgi:ribosomal protein L6P/L9E